MRPRGTPPGVRLLLGAALAVSGCGGAPGPDAPPIELPRPTTLEDPLILERVEQALAACEHGEPGALLALARVYDANELDELAVRAWDLAVAELESAGELGLPLARARYHRARALAEVGRVEEALAGFDSALPLAPGYAPLHWRRGELLFELGRTAEARTAFERALELEPDGVPQHLGLARVLLLEGEPEAAHALLEPLAKTHRREQGLHELMARASRALGDEERAARESARAGGAWVTSSDPWTDELLEAATGIEHHVRLAGEALALDDAARALQLLEPLYPRFPDDFVLLDGLARARNAAGQYAEAWELLQHARELYPDRFQLELQAGRAALGLGRVDDAKALLEHALELNPARGAIHQAYVEALLAEGSLPEAERALVLAIEHGERSGRSLRMLATLQRAQDAWARAAGTLAELVEERPGDAAGWAELAEARARTGDAAGAREALARSRELDPRNEAIGAAQAALAALEAGE